MSHEGTASRSVGAKVPRGERSAQAPEVVAWHRRLLGPFHVTGPFWYRFHLFGVRVLPVWALNPGIHFFASFFLLVLRRIRLAIIANLETVLGPASEPFGDLRRAFRVISNHSWCMTDTYRELAGLPRRGDALVEGEEHWQQVAGGERGFIVVTAHVGHWEVGSRIQRPGRERTLHVVREPEIDPESQRFLEGLLRRRAGETTRFHFVSDDPSVGIRLLAALRRGDIVALQGDRPSAAGRTAIVELFGRSFEMPVGPAALARSAGVPLFPIFVFRNRDGGSTLVFRPPIEVPRSGSRKADLEAATAEVARQVEWAIRRDPYQWFCFRRVWPDHSEARVAGEAEA